MSRSCTLVAAVCLLAGCNHYLKAVKQVAIAADQGPVEDARASAQNIEDALPIYIKDEGMARLERVEIAAVQADAAIVDGEKDPDRFISEVEKLKADWSALVALDEILQKEKLT
jgi:hypothetical protein